MGRPLTADLFGAGFYRGHWQEQLLAGVTDDAVTYNRGPTAPSTGPNFDARDSLLALELLGHRPPGSIAHGAAVMNRQRRGVTWRRSSTWPGAGRVAEAGGSATTRPRAAVIKRLRLPAPGQRRLTALDLNQGGARGLSASRVGKPGTGSGGGRSDDRSRHPCMPTSRCCSEQVFLKSTAQRHRNQPRAHQLAGRASVAASSSVLPVGFATGDATGGSSWNTFPPFHQPAARAGPGPLSAVGFGSTLNVSCRQNRRVAHELPAASARQHTGG